MFSLVICAAVYACNNSIAARIMINKKSKVKNSLRYESLGHNGSHDGPGQGEIKFQRQGCSSVDLDEQMANQVARQKKKCSQPIPPIPIGLDLSDYHRDTHPP